MCVYFLVLKASLGILLEGLGVRCKTSMVEEDLSKLWERLNLNEVEDVLVKVLDQEILAAA